MAIKKSLYYYTPADKWLFKNLKDSTLYFNNPTGFNDPYDCMAPMIYGLKSSEYLMSYLYDILIEGNLIEAILGLEKKDFLREWRIDATAFEKKIHKQLTKYVEKEFGILCLSIRPDIIKMWSHYSRKHSGVCLEFNFHEFLVGKNNFYWKVNYPRKNRFQDFLDNDVDPKDSFLGQLVTKSPEWKEEKEYRVLIPHSGVHTINKECLTRVIFGINTEQPIRNKIEKIITKAKYPNVKFALITKDEEYFKLHVKNYKTTKKAPL